MQPNNKLGYAGLKNPADSADDFNAQLFIIWSILAKVRTGTMVEVMGVTNSGGLSPVGFVDIMPLVNQIDGAGNATPHGIIYRCPYFRLQGGTNAVIIDPSVGDIGWAMIADRDISSVIANKGQANPGSRRMFDFSDAVYIGGMMNGTPSQYVQINATGVTITSNAVVTINAPSGAVINGNTQINGNLITSGNISDKNGISGTLQHVRDNYNAHTHTDPQGGTTGAPSNSL
jgi:hypothetical protein